MGRRKKGSNGLAFFSSLVLILFIALMMANVVRSQRTCYALLSLFPLFIGLIVGFLGVEHKYEGLVWVYGCLCFGFYGVASFCFLCWKYGRWWIIILGTIGSACFSVFYLIASVRGGEFLISLIRNRELPEMMKKEVELQVTISCPNCGTKISSETPFCHECGATLQI